MRKKIVFVTIVCIVNLLLFFTVLKFVLNRSPQSTLANDPLTNTTTSESSSGEATTETGLEETTTTQVQQEETKPQSTTSPTKSTKDDDPTDPTVATKAPTKPTTQTDDLPQWKQMYINYATAWRTRYDHFALVYIDGDDIPELYMYGSNRSELCAYRNDTVAPQKKVLISQQMNGMGGGNYHKKSGSFMNVYPENNYLVMRVYHLSDIFYQTFWGREDKTVDPPVYYIGNYTGAVSETEFKAAVSEYINTDKTTFLHENSLSFDEFVKYIKKQ